MIQIVPLREVLFGLSEEIVTNLLYESFSKTSIF